METRNNCVELIKEAMENGSRKDKACDILGLSVRTLERWEGSPVKGDMRKGPITVPANKLTQNERNYLLETCTSEEYRDLPPTQIVPLLADKGEYIASESTFYRVLKAEKLLAHRNDINPERRRRPQEYIATRPDQVWSWDVTYLKTYTKGLFYYLYMIMDVYSRKIVGWDVHDEDNSEKASVLAEITCMIEGIEEDQVVLHSDNGASQKGATMLGTLERLGVAASFSRPSVSNDNPYSESLFKTLKYVPAYPEKGFSNIKEAKEWVEKFVTWYNTIHLHSGIKFVTPEARHLGIDKDILENRKNVYERARMSNPNRWSGETRNWNHIEYVALNPLQETKKLLTLEGTIK